MKVAVTGAGGLLGRAIVADLAASGHEVTGIDRSAGPGVTQVADLRDPAAMAAAFAGADAVAHLAAWPNPLVATAREVWSDNVALAANAVFAAVEQGMGRFVYASSQSVLGLPWATSVVAPDYVPVDEDHPCRPSDVYSASKLAGEHLVAAHSRNGPLAAFALRFPVIWREEDFQSATGRRRDNPQQGAKSQWAYVDVRDAARAVRLALTAEATGYTLLNIAAPEVFSNETAEVLVRHWYPDTPIREGFGAAVFDSRRAERVLGFRARYRWRANGITVFPES